MIGTSVRLMESIATVAETSSDSTTTCVQRDIKHLAEN
jgi:hypothetical protein